MLLREYGRAIVYVNQVDYLVGVLIDYKKKCKGEFKCTCQVETLGTKIANHSSYLGELVTELSKLNKMRRTLAHHGFVTLHDLSEGTVRNTTIKESKIDVISKDELDLIVELSRKLIPLIIEEFIRR